MNVVLVGLNHKTAPLSLRQRFALGPPELPQALIRLRRETGNGVILSTCNRTELYFVAGQSMADRPKALGLLIRSTGADAPCVDQHVYFRANEEAVRHLHRVSSGLDSMIFGETEILGQVRAALAAAAEAGLCNAILNRLFHSVIRTGRRVHRETFVGQHGRSVSSAAVTLAQHLLGDLSGRHVLVVGMGEAGALTARRLVKAGADRLAVANRTDHRATELAEKLNATAIPFCSLTKALADTDVVITTSSAPTPIIGKGDLGPIMAGRNGRSILLIDIAVPPDIDPAVREMRGVRLYNIDDLDGMCPVRSEERESEMAKVDAIVEEEVQGFMAWWHSLKAVPTIVSLRQRLETVRREEVAKVRRHIPHLTRCEQEGIDAITLAILKKILHRPLANIKLHSGDQHYLAITRDLFGLDGCDRGQ